MKVLKQFIVILGTLLLCAVLLISYGYFKAFDTSSRINFIGSNDIIISNVRTVLNSQNNLQNIPVTLFIKDGRIKRIIKANTVNLVSEQANVLDGTGLYLLPGLIDAHAHIEDSAYLTLALSHGITTIRGMRGNGRQLKWRDEIKNRKWLGSDFIVASPILDNPNSDPFHQSVNNEAEAVQLIKHFFKQKYDLIKVYGDISPTIFAVIKNETQKLNIPLAKHGPYISDSSNLDELEGLVSVEHVENIYANLLHYEYEQTKVAELAEKLKQLNVPIVTTLSVFNELVNLAEFKNDYLARTEIEYMNPVHYELVKLFGIERWLSADKNEIDFNKKTYLNLLKITKQLNEAGVKLSVGSDSGALIGQAGQATLNEISILVKAGLSPKQALLMATAYAADAVNNKNIGVIEEGKDADLILLKNNPLKNIETLHSPEYVISKGRVLNKNKLAKLRANASKTENPLTTISYLLIDAWQRLNFI